MVKVLLVVNCFQKLCIFAAGTTMNSPSEVYSRCELLSKIVYICSWNNWNKLTAIGRGVVNCFQKLCIFAAGTTVLADESMISSL